MGRPMRWTPEHDAVLREVYLKRGGQAAAVRLGITLEQVWNRAGKLGLVSPLARAANWTPREDEILREHYPVGGAVACVPHLPGRSAMAIQNHAPKLGLVFRRRAGDPLSPQSYDHRPLAAALGMNTSVPASLARLPARVHLIAGTASLDPRPSSLESCSSPATRS